MAARRVQLAGDWLLVGAAGTLVLSLFLTWSHQYPSWVLRVPGVAAALAGVPRNPDAWQVYSVADVLLAALAAALLVTALVGIGRGIAALVVALGVALAFVVHASSVPPTSGAAVVLPGSRQAVRSLASTGPGETVAVVALAVALAGLCLSSIRGRNAH